MQYKELKLEDKNIYEKYWQACPEKTADYIFTNLWAWNNYYQFEIAEEDNLIWLKTNKCFRAPIGDWTAVDFTKTKFFENVFSENKKIELKNVPQTLKNILVEQFGDKITAQEDLSSDEYVYKQEALAYLKGNKYHKKKNHVNNFVKNYGVDDVVDYRAFTPDTISKEEIDEILELCAVWAAKNKDDEAIEPPASSSPSTLDAEFTGIKAVLENINNFPSLIGGRLYVEDNLAAFALGEKLDENTIVVHFEKANLKYRASFQAINKFFAENAGEGFEFVDREQDLGDEGLRKAKESYHPSHKLKKYIITIN